MDNLPEDLKVRANSLFVSVLRYIVDLLVWDKGSSLPDGMQPEGGLDDQYHCMLFNDEVHTYDQVMLPFLCWGVVLGVGWYLRCEGRRQSCPFGVQVGVGL